MLRAKEFPAYATSEAVMTVAPLQKLARFPMPTLGRRILHEMLSAVLRRGYNQQARTNWGFPGV